MADLISLPSGKVINLDQVSWLFRSEDDTIITFFSAGISGPKGATWLRLEIVEPKDIDALVKEFERRNLDVSALKGKQGRARKDES